MPEATKEKKHRAMDKDTFMAKLKENLQSGGLSRIRYQHINLELHWKPGANPDKIANMLIKAQADEIERQQRPTRSPGRGRGRYRDD